MYALPIHDSLLRLLPLGASGEHASQLKADRCVSIETKDAVGAPKSPIGLAAGQMACGSSAMTRRGFLDADGPMSHGLWHAHLWLELSQRFSLMHCRDASTLTSSDETTDNRLTRPFFRCRRSRTAGSERWQSQLSGK